MRKTLIAMAAVTTAGAALAQSSVTVYGTIDANWQSVRGDGNGSVQRVQNSGINNSRLGFRGIEDLGGGLAAKFTLEAGLANDTGTGAASNTNNQSTGAAVPLAGGQGLVFNRVSTVGLAGPWGEVRLGRDHVPSFFNLLLFDPFFGNGVGSVGNLSIGGGFGTNGIAKLPTAIRASNSVGYFLPSGLGGIYGQAMYALGENASNAVGTQSDGKYKGARVGFAQGPFDIALASGRTTYSASSVAGGDYVQTNLGASYKFGTIKVFGQGFRDEIKAAASSRQTGWLAGATAAVGAGEIRASYVRVTVSGTSTGAAQYALGYVHNLSKRTALYSTYARVDNRGTGVLFHNGRASTTPGGNSTGLEAGIRHFF